MNSAATAAVFGIPTIIPSGVLAMPGRPGANDRIVYGHIGIGGMGQNHVAYRSMDPNAIIGGLCDVDSDHLYKMGKRISLAPRNKGCLLTKDYRELLDRKDIDAISIATPDHWHAIMAVHACQAGKDVYSEKPTCKTIQEGQAMINAANYYKRVVQIGMQGRSNPAAAAACNFIRNGQIGKVSHVEVWHEKNPTGHWVEDEDPPANLDYDMWLGPARWRHYNPSCCHFNFRWLMEFGAGYIRDRGNHVLNVVMWCMGADNTGPVSVEATGQPAPEGQWDVPVTMEAKWEFKNPDWTLTWSQPGRPCKVPNGSSKLHSWGAIYHGDRDTLVVSEGDSECETEPRARAYVPPPGGFNAYLEPGYGEAWVRHNLNWKSCIKSRNKPVAPPEIGARVVTLAITANIALQLKRKLQWDPVNERFVGDEEANRMLAQPYRAPFHL